MTIKRFEDILAWQKARVLTRDIYSITRQEPVCRDFRFCSQIQAVSVSIMSNIAEGFERRVTRQFDQFLVIAKASCAEVRSLTYVGLDASYFNDDTFNHLQTQADEVGRLIGGFRKSFTAAKAVTRNSELGTQNFGRSRVG